MEENRDKIDNEMNNNKETKENEQKINNDCNCGCEHCGPDGCSEEDCKECDKECDCKSESKAGENACEDSTVGANACEDSTVGANACEDNTVGTDACEDSTVEVDACEDSTVGANACGAQEKDELTLANEKIKDWEDKYKRLLAEFDNFRKRSEKESAMMIDIGASMILTKILPVVDNFERAINSIPEDLKGNAFVEGIDKIYKQMLKTFEDLGVKPIEAVGKPFDANLHNAVMTDENAEGEVDTVVEELQKGYTYKDQVLRHSMVKVKK